MRLLILGGTAFLGRHLVSAALARGDDVTIFHRGRTNPDIFPEVEKILGDRIDSLHPLEGRVWDAVIDTSGYHPNDVQRSAEFLRARVGRYVFISTISVYAGFDTPGMDEAAPVARLQESATAEVSNETYGPLKTHCEDAVQAVYGDRALIIRPGLIVGPFDPTDRFTYWPVRAQRGGEILAPQGPDVPVQYIDARDLASWTLHATAQNLIGVYNATGPNVSHNMGELLASCRRVSGVDAQITWVSPEFIDANSLVPFVDLPLWVPPAMAGLLTVDCSRAFAAGLVCRPTDETVRATLAWHATRDPATPLRAGLTAEREAQLLALWHARAA